MAIEPFKWIPKDIREWSAWMSKARVTPTDGTVTDDAFANRQALSVFGRASNTAGAPADIVAPANNYFLVRRDSALTFAPLAETDIPATIARDSEVAASTAAAAAALSAHVAAPDPHTGYRLESVNVPWAEVSGKPAAVGMLYSGTGNPDGAVAAPVGSLFLRTDGGTGSSLYVKETGAATSSGWVAK